MITFDANQQRIVDADHIEAIDWLFVVVDNNVPTTYYWSTKDVTVNGQDYDFRVVDFTSLTIRRRTSEAGIQAPHELVFAVSNPNNTLTASDFVGGTVTLTLRATDDTGTENLLTWKFDIRKAEPAYQEILLTCEDFLQKALRGSYPNTRLVKEIFPSDDAKSDNVCVPIPIGTAYIPIRSVYVTGDSARYYLLGPNARTFVVDKVRSPRQWNSKSVWDSGSYSLNILSKADPDAVSWKVLEPIIADSDADGSADAVGLWREGDAFLDMPTKFTRDDTKDFGGSSTGTHTGGTHATILTDSGASWTVDALIGYYVVNVTDGSYGKITDNAATTATVSSLTGGTGNNWENGDSYYICGPASVISFILQDMGVAAADIDDTSFMIAEKTFSGWGLAWNGAYYYKRDRGEVLAELLNMCHATISVRDKIYLRVLSKTSQKTLDKTFITKRSDIGKGTFAYKVTLSDTPLSDAGYVAWQEADEPQDEFVKTRVPVVDGGGMSYVSDETLVVPFVQDSQDVQRLGTLWLQKILLRSGDVSFASKPKALALEPDDVITINHADYGGSYNVLIDSITIHRDLSMAFTCFTFSSSLEDWSDISPAAITITDDDSTDVWQPVISGPSSEGSQMPNLVRGDLRIGSGSDHIMIYPGDHKIESSNYVAGEQGEGFTLSPDLLEVGNVAVRGIIRMAVFQKDVVSAIGGDLLVRPADVLDVDMANDGTSLTIEGNETFSTGDFLRIKDGTDDEWLEIIAGGTPPQYNVTRDKASAYSGSGTWPEWKKGATVVNYGASGEGGLFLTSAHANAPFMEIFTHAGSPWSALTGRVRVGNLNGFLDYASDIYGFAAGSSAAGQANICFDPTNGLRLRSGTDNKIVIDNAGNVTITGTITATSGTIGGWSITAASLHATNIVLNSNDKYISINNTTFGQPGIQLQYNAGSPQMFVGSGTEYLQYTTAGGVAVSSSQSNALTIKSGGSILLEAGGDVVLEAAATDPATIVWDFGSSIYAYLGGDTTDGALKMWSYADDSGAFVIGQDPTNADLRFRTVEFFATRITRMQLDGYATGNAYIGSIDTGSVVYTQINANVGAIEAEAFFHADTTNGYLSIEVTDGVKIGTPGSVYPGVPGDWLHVHDYGVNSAPAIRIQNDAQAWRAIVDGADGDKFKLSDATGSATYPFIIEPNAPTNSLYVDSNGYMGVGLNPVYHMHVHEPSSGVCYAHFTNTSTGTTTGDGLSVGLNASEQALFWNRENTNTIIGANNANRITCYNTGGTQIHGRLGVGGAPGATYPLKIYVTTDDIVFRDADYDGSAHNTEDGYIEVDVGGQVRHIKLYRS